jgi:N6-adenosine-specific RNA methylase IME4
MEYHQYANLFPMMNPDEQRALCDDMRAFGYDTTAPIVLFNGVILDGRNRQVAADTVGVAPNYITFEGSDQRALEYVIRHNLHRRHLNESQRAVIAGRLANMGEGGNHYANLRSGQISQSAAAEMLNVSPRTVASAKQVERDAPELIAKIESGEMTVNEAVRTAKKAAVVANLESIEAQEAKAIEGVYDVVVIDPPWPMEKIERDVAPNQVAFEYPTMTLDQIAALEIPTADNCHVWLWTTHKFLPAAIHLLDTWGLKYVCCFTWHKPGGFQPWGLPQYNCEFALYARKGTPSFIDTKDFMVCFNGARGSHSEKPQGFYDVVKRVTAGRRLDMFNRRKIGGFDGWGKEAA